MPTNQTENYALSQWAKSDQVQMEDFNADNAKIDEALGALTETAAAHAAALALRGNCRIGVLTYTGTGKNGDGAYVTITFPARPVIFFIFGPSFLLVAPGEGEGKDNLVIGSYRSGYGTTFSGTGVAITWTENTAQIPVPEGMPGLNTKDHVHRVVALYATDN